MALLNDEILGNVREMLGGLTNDVTLVVFTDDQHCDYCKEILQLANEVAATSDLLTVEQYEIHKDKEKAEELSLKRAPVIAILGQADYGIRFYGIPSGYEFSTLMHGIQKASEGVSALDDTTRYFLAGLPKPVEIEVFVTPTCPYCPQAAILAMDMAVESKLVNADVVESAEFPTLANSYNVMGVPLSVINGAARVEGAAPPKTVLEAIRQAIA